MEMTRQEHLDWAKTRALEYLDEDDLTNALASMVSDMGKHPETIDHPASTLMMGLMMTGHLDNPSQVREFIEGFN